jgi:hypothetical protein
LDPLLLPDDPELPLEDGVLVATGSGVDVRATVGLLTGVLVTVDLNVGIRPGVSTGPALSAVPVAL